ncbi:3-oxoacyl-[acyl-carrier-protein] reductase [Paraperlucidibaca baekdonensis]|uniref:3-oxoacyl-[acyl-carrier-protein] reductase n=1 Tax=Paraperlucidibaca baekdonensis TaxID=748120 RepID=A0A3E0H6S2_9GAMM|nr:3-oxoacyl-ACP reductase FabG [Paraperlucidibaca baekdonensis]REH38918.1 3-oxoacyl-[acyl-carrier-protein] reductase [Paraperlucidibaca baekdonensis]
MSESEKIALVTGATRGIGRAIALALGQQGHTVIGTATSADGAARISAAFAEAGIKGQGLVLNVADPESIEQALTSIHETFGAPQILVNNAGITRDNLMLRMKADEWDEVINTNLSAIFRLTKACLKGMTKARWGRIVNISSVVGSMGNPGQANYAAAKAGLEGFGRALAAEIASRNITVNAIAPGFIETDMTTALPEAQRELLLKQVPAGRLGQPQDIASAVAFLTSESASYITGTTLHVNGGMYMA